MPKLCIIGCQNFLPEMQACLASEGWEDVVIGAFPSRCGRPPVQWEELRTLLPDDCSDVVIFGRACLASLGVAPADFPKTRKLVHEQCFHLIAGTTLVNKALSGGAYLMTPEWLLNWRRHLDDLGMAGDTVKVFFQDFAKSLMLLDTGVNDQVSAHLTEIQAATGLPAQTIAVGLDHLCLLLGRIVLEWRLTELQSVNKQLEQDHAREIADQMTAMDLLGRMTKTREETEVIAAIEDLFRMLFAPTVWHFVSAETWAGTTGSVAPASVGLEIQRLVAAYDWTASGEGFLLRVARDDHVYGHIVVDGLAFPQYRVRYLNLALAMSDMMALAIESARTRKRLVEAEKMASLGVVVAGVAHEINTPVGVGVLAASTLMNRTRALSQSFSERRMTQSDLQTYLKDSDTQSSLILSNLERIGLLVDKFRQVAVNGLPQATSRFRIKDCINEVIHSLGDRLPPERISVSLDCDDTLELDSYLSDWSSIFSNLFVNSLQHGFSGRDRGCIRVEVDQNDSTLTIVFADDGHGLSPMARERIFDPFFTTDMQNGIGLGMHFVYNLITHRLHGRIAIESDPEAGACFRIEVPNHQDVGVVK